MLFKSLKLSNYKQFKHETEIDFGDFNIIYGLKASGKTTLLDAFSWILYGESMYKKNKLLNIEKAESMNKGDIQSISGSLEIYHNKNVYKIKRTQDYLCFSNQIIKPDISNLKIKYFTEHGEFKDMESNNLQSYINQILRRWYYEY